ncbi:lipocalin family protein [Salinimicrobium catena]|uniref:lipocalin family protein n=1 Tax=Salinimicrobium catena TaxID=390640 RepID=UPI002FE4460C
MKKILYLLTLIVVFSCSKDDEPNEKFVLTHDYLIGTTWTIHSYEGNTDLDECDRNEKIRFSEDRFYQTIAFWNDAFLEEDCSTHTSDTRYKVEDGKLDIEYDGSTYFPRFLDKNTLEVHEYFSDFDVKRVYKKNP